jgi:hypothetical protein
MEMIPVGDEWHPQDSRTEYTRSESDDATCPMQKSFVNQTDLLAPKHRPWPFHTLLAQHVHLVNPQKIPRYVSSSDVGGTRLAMPPMSSIVVARCSQPKLPNHGFPLRGGYRAAKTSSTS